MGQVFPIVQVFVKMIDAGRGYSVLVRKAVGASSRIRPPFIYRLPVAFYNLGFVSEYTSILKTSLKILNRTSLFFSSLNEFFKSSMRYFSNLIDSNSANFFVITSTETDFKINKDAKNVKIS